MHRFQIGLNLAAIILIFIALVIPNRISEINLSSLLFFALELPLLCLVLMVPGRSGLLLRWIMAAFLAVGLIFKCADMGTYNVFARPFNPVFDGYLFANGMNLLNGAVGAVGAVLVAVLLTSLVLAIIAGAFWMLGRVQRLLCISVYKSAAFLLAGVLLWLMLFFSGSNKASVQFYQHLSMHVTDIIATVKDIQSFNALLDKNEQLDRDQKAEHKNNTNFALLRDKNVLVIFVESYGRTVLDNPEFSAQIRPLLERTSKDLREAGFTSRSGYLTSPTVGGLSWLAHGTAMSGLWIDNQIRYNSLMLSQQPTLNRLFKKAGWRTVAVMPAITMDWPEGKYYGYDHIYDAHNLGYQGKPFNWVTMPDQYTLSAFHARELAQRSPTPVMAEIALISSHAPWTPIPHLIDWNEVSNGVIFNEQATSGDTPEQVWKDTVRIRLQFRLSIEYALETIASYVMNYGDENLVVLILGDHQPAPIVTGETSRTTPGSRDVPVHLIARDPKVMEAIAHWNWTPGMLPAADAPVWRMDELRNRFIDAFSPPTN